MEDGKMTKGSALFWCQLCFLGAGLSYITESPALVAVSCVVGVILTRIAQDDSRLESKEGRVTFSERLIAGKRGLFDRLD